MEKNNCTVNVNETENKTENREKSRTNMAEGTGKTVSSVSSVLSGTSAKALSALISFLTVVGLIATVINLAVSLKTGTWRSAEVEATSLASHIAVILYSLYAYRIPKGNHLKYAYLLFSLCLVLIVTETRTEEFSPAWLFLLGISIIPASFMAGRLDRFGQNKVIILVGTALLLAASILEVSRLSGAVAEGILPDAGGILKPAILVSAFDPFIVWIALGKAYVKRYEAHRAAGKA